MPRARLPRLRRFGRDEDATATIEFILTFPLLSLLLMGSFVWFDAFRSYSLASKVSYTLSDIGSRWASSDSQPHVTEAELQNLFEAHKRLLPPRVEDGWLRVSSVCFDGADLRVLWSYVADDTLAAALADPDDDVEPRLGFLTDDTVPEAIIPPMSPGDSVLLTETYSSWTPIADWAGFGPTTWTNRLVTRPRFRAIVPFDPGATAFPYPGYPDAQSKTCPAAT